MPRRTRLTCALAASLILGAGTRARVQETRLHITSLRVSSIVALGETFGVSVTATDPIGILEVEVSFQRQLVRLPALRTTRT